MRTLKSCLLLFLGATESKIAEWQPHWNFACYCYSSFNFESNSAKLNRWHEKHKISIIVFFWALQNPKWPTGSHIRFLLVIALALTILKIVQWNSTDNKRFIKFYFGVSLGARKLKMADWQPYWFLFVSALALETLGTKEFKWLTGGSICVLACLFPRYFLSWVCSMTDFEWAGVYLLLPCNEIFMPPLNI